MIKIIKVLFKEALLAVGLLLLLYTFKIGWSDNGSMYHKLKMLQRNQNAKSSERLFKRLNSSALEDVKAVGVSSERLSNSALEDVKPFKVSSIHDFYKLMQSRLEHLRNVCQKPSDHGQSLTSKASLNVSLADKSRSHVRMYMFKKEKVAFCPIPKAASTAGR